MSADITLGEARARQPGCSAQDRSPGGSSGGGSRAHSRAGWFGWAVGRGEAPHTNYMGSTSRKDLACSVLQGVGEGGAAREPATLSIGGGSSPGWGSPNRRPKRGVCRNPHTRFTFFPPDAEGTAVSGWAPYPKCCLSQGSTCGTRASQDRRWGPGT